MIQLLTIYLKFENLRNVKKSVGGTEKNVNLPCKKIKNNNLYYLLFRIKLSLKCNVPDTLLNPDEKDNWKEIIKQEYIT